MIASNGLLQELEGGLHKYLQENKHKQGRKYFYWMKTKLPVKSLSKVNWLMTIASTDILSIFLFTYRGVTNEAIFVIVQNTISITLMGFFHVFVLLMLEKHGGNLSSQKSRLYRIIITYIGIVLYSFLISPVRDFFAEPNWNVATFSQRLVAIIFGSMFLNTIILIVHNSVILFYSKNEADFENAQLKAANAEANNLLLKQQIHPHFLFNALNVLKSLYKKDVSAGDTYIVHLANFLRASLSNTSAKLVSLADEIKLCDDYIAMQKLRFGNALHYEMNISPVESNSGLIPSFSLQPLLENAIKHNDVTEDKPLTIQVYTADGYIVVANNLQRKKGSVISTGNGLTNLMKRYELISGDDVIIEENENNFYVRLKILKA